MLKNLITTLAVAFIVAAGPAAINGQNIDPAFPLNPSRSVVFGWDIFINDQPVQDQQESVICSTYDGTLFAGYYYDNSGIAYVSIMKSSDAGKNWTLFFNDGLGIGNCIFTRVDLAVIGSTEETLKLLLGGVFVDTTKDGGGAFIAKINGLTGQNEGYLLLNSMGRINDLSIATDFPNSAGGSNPFSVGVLYSYNGTLTDSVVFYSSGDGGLTLGNRQVVAATGNYFHKVKLTYGYSPAFPTGRYYAAWEEQDYASSESGHIYTAHSDPNFNSPFTIPVCLDCNHADLSKRCRNPVIACLNGNNDNDSLNITETVIFENFKIPGNNYDLTGFYNKRAANNDNFLRMNITQTPENEVQPGICYNHFDSTFMLTYYDVQNKKLPFLKNDFNLTEPEEWTVLSSGYNDNPNLANPYPMVILNFEKQSGAAVWRSERSGGNGAIMYDAEYIYYTGLPENNGSESVQLFGVHPNPCTDQATIVFELKKASPVTIDLYSIMGMQIRTITNREHRPGVNEIETAVSDLPPGVYIIRLTADSGVGVRKIVKE